jgi:Flp pilus assembly protein TadG
MPSSTDLPSRFRILGRFGRSTRGSTAVEFALVAPLFFALLFAIIETALVFFAGQLLETGTQDAARSFLVSQAQKENFDAATFKKKICDNVVALFSCSDVYIDVRSFPKGDVVTFLNPIDGTGNFVNNTVYQMPTKSDDTVVIRAFYQWPLYVTKLGYNIANIGRGTANSKHLLVATAALRPQ